MTHPVHQLDGEEQRTQATIRKLIATVMKFPHASAAPCFFASASEPAVTFPDKAVK